MKQARSQRDRLLEGEDPESLRPQETRHWISVYREMIAFKDDLPERVTGDLMHVSAPANTDLNDDIRLIDSQLKTVSKTPGLLGPTPARAGRDRDRRRDQNRHLPRQLSHADKARVSDPGEC